MKLQDFIKAFQNVDDFTVTLVPVGAPCETIQDSHFFSNPEEYECGDSEVTSFVIDAANSEIYIHCK